MRAAYGRPGTWCSGTGARSPRWPSALPSPIPDPGARRPSRAAGAPGGRGHPTSPGPGFPPGRGRDRGHPAGRSRPRDPDGGAHQPGLSGLAARRIPHHQPVRGDRGVHPAARRGPQHGPHRGLRAMAAGPGLRRGRGTPGGGGAGVLAAVLVAAGSTARPEGWTVAQPDVAPASPWSCASTAARREGRSLRAIHRCSRTKGPAFTSHRSTSESRRLEHPGNLTPVERARSRKTWKESARCARATPHEPERCRHDLVEGGHGRELEPACRERPGQRRARRAWGLPGPRGAYRAEKGMVTGRACARRRAYARVPHRTTSGPRPAAGSSPSTRWGTGRR